MGNGSTSDIHPGCQVRSQSDDVLKPAAHVHLFGSTQKLHVNSMRGDPEVVSGTVEPPHDNFVGADLPAEFQLSCAAHYGHFRNAQFFVGG